MRTLSTRVSAALMAVTAALLAACTAMPAAPLAPPRLAYDQHFGPASAVEPPADIFGLSPAMRAYADEHLNPAALRALGMRDPRQALVSALYQNNRLRLRYDASETRTAAQAFEQRAGNCLSLVLMTGAFAKYLGLPVTYQVLDVDETHERRGGLYLSSGHVNLVLQRQALPPLRRGAEEDGDLVVDFLPGRDVAGARVRPLDEALLTAMFHNNRAAELLAAGQTGPSYWQARAAVLQAPGFMPALNTLAVIYQRAGLADAAEQAYRQVLDREPRNVAALSNLVGALQRQGRLAEAEPAARLLARLQPLPPFQAFDRGRLAMEAGDYQAAKRLFEQELEHQPYQAEVHHWAAMANWHLGHQSLVLHHLAMARDNSSNPSAQDRYSAKLQSLRSLTH
jgi:hypothetical protein